eukprot:GHVO01033285.1.p1 GENE.GHVO01033285.1~~GHVO01033285.1.p1  ORF type:complete len:201 (-),score=41.34 GHVO01033285.1:43-645(-)
MSEESSNGRIIDEKGVLAFNRDGVVCRIGDFVQFVTEDDHEWIGRINLYKEQECEETDPDTGLVSSTWTRSICCGWVYFPTDLNQDYPDAIGVDDLPSYGEREVLISAGDEGEGDWNPIESVKGKAQIMPFDVYTRMQRPPRDAWYYRQEFNPTTLALNPQLERPVKCSNPKYRRYCRMHGYETQNGPPPPPPPCPPRNV